MSSLPHWPEGTVGVLRERLEAGPAALELAVERVQDHLADGRTEMLSAPGWQWAEDGAAEADRRVRAELAALAGQ